MIINGAGNSWNLGLKIKKALKFDEENNPKNLKKGKSEGSCNINTPFFLTVVLRSNYIISK